MNVLFGIGTHGKLYDIKRQFMNGWIIMLPLYEHGLQIRASGTA